MNCRTKHERFKWVYVGWYCSLRLITYVLIYELIIVVKFRQEKCNLTIFTEAVVVWSFGAMRELV